MPSGSHWKRSLSRWLSGNPAWIDQLDPKILPVFVHLPKAGGTSINDFLKRVYGRGFLNVSNHAREWKQRRTSPDGVRCLAGHFKFGYHRALGRCGEKDWPKDGLFTGRDIRYVTVVREPVARVKSFYRYVKAAPKHRLHKATIGMTPREFFDYLESIGVVEPWNQQSRRMGGKPEDRFFLCAPLDELDRFVEVLGAALGWPSELQVPHSNKTRKPRREDDGFDPELVSMIEERSAEDSELFLEVSERFKAGDFPAFRISS